MTELMQASNQWASRPDDERFTSLTDMLDHFTRMRDQSRALVLANRRITVQPPSDTDYKGLTLVGEGVEPHNPTHWAFGQLASLAGAPAGYLRDLPSPLAADCVNYGLHHLRGVEEVGLLLQNGGDNHTVRAATGPRYGRIWNADVCQGLVRRFGNGLDGDFRVPGEFGKAVQVNKDNTTLYASDRDMFVFLADEKNRIEIPGRRNGAPGQLARGFFCWNSEVGDKTFGLGTFLFDYVCCNRIVWGATEYQEIRIRHSAGAPDRWVEEFEPALLSYSNSATTGITEAVKKAQAARLDNVDEFLANRFGTRMVDKIKAVHMLEEDRPVETVWDATVAVTAYAKSIKHQDERVALERQGGELMKLAA